MRRITLPLIVSALALLAGCQDLESPTAPTLRAEAPARSGGASTLLFWDFASVTTVGSVSTSQGAGDVAGITGLASQLCGGPAEPGSVWNAGAGFLHLTRSFGTGSGSCYPYLEIVLSRPMQLLELAFDHAHNHNPGFSTYPSYQAQLQLDAGAGYADVGQPLLLEGSNLYHSGAAIALDLPLESGTYRIRWVPRDLKPGAGYPHNTDTEYFAVKNVRLGGRVLPSSETPVGKNVTVNPIDEATGKESQVKFTFPEVMEPGETKATTRTFGTSGALRAPSGFHFPSNSYFEVSTTAKYLGEPLIEVAVPEAKQFPNLEMIQLLEIVAVVDVTGQVIEMTTTTLPATYDLDANVISTVPQGSDPAPAPSVQQNGGSLIAFSDEPLQTIRALAVAQRVYEFSGFFTPVHNDVVNVAKAGSAIPVKFSLNGDEGLAIFQSGSPSARVISCDDSAPEDVVSATVTAGGSNLSYDAATQQYTYVWKSEKGWAGTCRTLTLEFKDGITVRTASFKFTR